MVWHRGGGPIPDEVRDAIARRLGRDGGGHVRERGGPEWMGWIAQDGWAPGAEDGLPSDRGGWRGTGSLRLDDRGSLAERLRDRVGEGAEDDAALAWRAFAAWGDRAPAHWIGDYAIAALAPAGDRLIAARGTVGVLPCFYAVAGPMIVVADDPATIAVVEGVDLTLDERAVAEYLGTGDLLTPTVSFRRGIRRVPAAHTVRFDRGGGIGLTRHWDLPTPAIREARREDEVVDGFREVVARAVRDRVRGPAATILLSGGLDSPLLAATARSAVPAGVIRATTVSWRRLLPDDDEAEWASMVARRLGLPHEIVEMDPVADLTDDSPLWTPEPSPEVEPRLWREFSRRLAARAPVALLGDDLDTLLSPAPLADQLRVEGLVTTMRRWRAYRRATGRRPWVGLGRSSGTLERARDRRWRRPPSWLRSELLRRNPYPDVPEARPHPTRSLAARALAQPLWESTLWSDAPPISGAPVHMLLPYMDPRVIEFCFALPSVPWCQRKHLARAALRGLVPEAIVERPKRPLQGYYEARAEAWRGIARPRPLPAAVDEWVDVAQWERVMAGAGSADEIFAAWRVIEFSRWLAQPEAMPA